jgi:hypothetical protein
MNARFAQMRETPFPTFYKKAQPSYLLSAYKPWSQLKVNSGAAIHDDLSPIIYIIKH